MTPKRWPYPSEPPEKPMPEGLRVRPGRNRSKRTTQGHTRIVAAKGRRVIIPPPVPEGHARRSVCRNTARITTRGYLRQHRDLFGHDCSNKALA